MLPGGHQMLPGGQQMLPGGWQMCQNVVFHVFTLDFINFSRIAGLAGPGCRAAFGGRPGRITADYIRVLSL